MKTATHSLSLAQWRHLEDLAEKVEEAQRALSSAALGMMGEHEPTNLTLLKIVENGSSSYMLHPQSEWTGGDSMNEANTVYREPHIVGNFPGHIR